MQRTFCPIYKKSHPAKECVDLFQSIHVMCLSRSTNFPIRDVISEALKQAGKDVYIQLVDLLQGKTVATYIDTNISCRQLQNSPASIFSLLLMSGYFKVVKSEPSILDGYLCHLAISNKEIEKQLANMLAATVR